MTNELHPTVKKMWEGDEDDRNGVKLLAGLARSAMGGNDLDMSDPELASNLIALQDAGALTVFMDDDGMGIELHTENEHVRNEIEQQSKGETHA